MSVISDARVMPATPPVFFWDLGDGVLCIWAWRCQFGIELPERYQCRYYATEPMGLCPFHLWESRTDPRIPDIDLRYAWLTCRIPP